MKLFISFSARKTGNCALIMDLLKAPHDKAIHYMDLNTHGCGNCDYECFKTQCRYRDDDVYRLYSSFESYEKVILLVPMYCGNPSSLYFGFNERSQDFFMHHEKEYSSFVEKLFIIGIYGSRKESPDFIRCLEKWFEGTPYPHHVLGIQRHMYQQTMKDSVINIDPVKMALQEFIR